MLLAGYRQSSATRASGCTLARPGSCFGGPLFEYLLAADRVYALDDDKVRVAPSRLSDGRLPTAQGRSRLQIRFDGEAQSVGTVLAVREPLA